MENFTYKSTEANEYQNIDHKPVIVVDFWCSEQEMNIS